VPHCCSARTNGSRGRGPGPCWSVSCVPRKGVLRDPRPLRLWLSSPVVAWPSTLTKPRCAGIGRPNSQPQPACANAQQPQPGPVATRRLVVVVDEDHPLNRRTPQGRAFLATSVPESFLAVTLGHLRHQLPGHIRIYLLVHLMHLCTSMQHCSARIHPATGQRTKDENIAPEHMNNLGLLVLIFQRAIRRDRLGLQSPWPPNIFKVLFDSHIYYVNSNR
jgi:hypothetical protein